MATCPNGHESSTADYCDTCGAPIDATVTLSSTPAPAPPPAPASVPCPTCGEPVDGSFCEACGTNLETGAVPQPATVTLHLSADRAHWDRLVGSGDPAFPPAYPTLSFDLTGDGPLLLGRVKTGAQDPAVQLQLTGPSFDPAASHSQSTFTRDGQAWIVRDADSSNGTWVNDATEPLAAGAEHRLADGDRILVGAWTCLTVRVGRPSGASAPVPAP